MRVHPDGSVLSVARGDGVVQLIALTKKVSAAEPNPLATPLRLRACVGVGERVYETCAWVRGRVHTWWLGRGPHGSQRKSRYHRRCSQCSQ